MTKLFTLKMFFRVSRQLGYLVSGHLIGRGDLLSFSMKGAIMNQGKLIVLLCLLLVIVGCDSKASSLKERFIADAKPTATPAPAPAPLRGPAPQPDKTVIEGNIFLELSDHEHPQLLAGVKIQLLDATDFEKRFEKTKKVILVRWLCREIYDLDAKIRTQGEERRTWEVVTKKKEEEKQECVTVGWSEFTYFDPFTGQSYTGDFKDGVIVPFMQRNIEKLHMQLEQVDRIIQGLRERRTRRLAEIRKLDPSMNTDDSYLRPLVRDPRLIEKLGMERAIEYQSSQDLIEDLDRSTVDHLPASVNGDFCFKVNRDGKKYMCYASYIPKTHKTRRKTTVHEESGEQEQESTAEDGNRWRDTTIRDEAGVRERESFTIEQKQGRKTTVRDKAGDRVQESITEEEHLEAYSWILLVPQDAEGYRKVVLSDKNSIDNEKWNETMRVDNMDKTLLDWLQNF